MGSTSITSAAAPGMSRARRRRAPGRDALAVFIGVASRGSATALARARVASERIHDPWRRALALERLSRAVELLEAGDLPSLAVTRREATPARFAIATAVLATGVAVGQTTGNRLALLVVLAGTLSFALIDWMEHRSALPDHLVSYAKLDPDSPLKRVVELYPQRDAGWLACLRARLVAWWAALSAAAAFAAEIAR